MVIRTILLVIFVICLSNPTDASCQVQLSTLIGKEEIHSRLQEVTDQLNSEYQGKEIVLVMVMKGAICLTSNLMQLLQVPFTLEYITASSYRGTQAGELTVHGVPALNIHDKHVLLIDDIFDTGNTITTIRTKLLAQQPASLKTLVLLVKNVQRTTSYLPDFVLFTIENHFVVGYGLDYNDHYRGLPGIYILNENVATIL